MKHVFLISIIEFLLCTSVYTEQPILEFQCAEEESRYVAQAIKIQGRVEGETVSAKYKIVRSFQGDFSTNEITVLSETAETPHSSPKDVLLIISRNTDNIFWAKADDELWRGILSYNDDLKNQILAQYVELPKLEPLTISETEKKRITATAQREFNNRDIDDISKIRVVKTRTGWVIYAEKTRKNLSPMIFTWTLDNQMNITSFKERVILPL